MKIERYLGDGAYATFDGFGVKVWTEREAGMHWIYLEPDALRNLLDLNQEIIDKHTPSSR